MNIEAESKTIQEFVDKENFHAAMNIAISAMNEGRRADDQYAVDHFRAPLKIAFFRHGSVSSVLESSCSPCTLRFCARCFLALTKKF